MLTGMIRFTRHLRAAHEGRATGTRLRAIVALLTVVFTLAALQAEAGLASAPPVLNVRGQTLKWTIAGTHNAYRLMRRTPDGYSVSTVVGRNSTPPPEPGVKVFYRVRAAYGESTWSNRVSITYEPEPPEPPLEAPLEEPKPVPPPVEPPTEELQPPVEESPPAEGEEAPSEAAGDPNYRLDAATYFDPFALATYVSWVKSHVSVIKGYPSFSDIYIKLFGMPVVGYHDPATEGQAPLGQSGIEAFVAKVNRDMAHGYVGVHIDDANWSSGYNPSPGPRAALANLIEAVHAAQPTAEIEINSQYHDIWPLMKAHDPDVERALRYVNVVTKEFGVGPTAGINTAKDYGEFLQYVDTLHSKGIHTSMTGDYGPGGNTIPVMEYNLATYFLINDGGDFVNGLNQTPTHWWKGFDVNLGEATGNRERSSSGVWKRSFAHGVVYTVEPQAATQTIKLASPMHSAEWGTVESVTLGPGQGAVLVE